MALYHVTRTDTVQPGEFVDAHVLAGGTALARGKFSHMEGVKPNGSNLRATRIDVGKADQVLSVYFDEREVEIEPVDPAPYYPMP